MDAYCFFPESIPYILFSEEEFLPGRDSKREDGNTS